MGAPYVPQGRSRRFVLQKINLQHFRVHIYLGVIDSQRNELDDRFDEVNMELLTCMSKDRFSSFDKEKVLKLATFYPSEFSGIGLMALESQFHIFIEDMQRDHRFGNLHDLGSLSMLIKTKKHVTYPKFYFLIKLALILPVATAGVERVFSGMTYIKNKLRNSMGDQLLNNCLVTFIEKDVFLQVPDNDIVDRFRMLV